MYARISEIPRKYIFSTAVAANMFAMTVLLIALSVLGFPEMAAEMGIVQGATLAVFLAFSANARNLILREESDELLRSLFLFRVTMLLPLAAAAYLLSKGVIDSYVPVTLVLIIRRCMEWLADLHISERERTGDRIYGYLFVSIQGFTLVLVIGSLVYGDETHYLSSLSLWAVSPVLLSVKFAFKTFSVKGIGFLPIEQLVPHLGSSWIIGVSTYLFRVVLVLIVGKSTSGLLFSAYAIGGMLNSVYTYAIGPSRVLQEENFKSSHIDRMTGWVVAGLFVGGVVTLIYLGIESYQGTRLFESAIAFSLLGAGVMMLAQYQRIRILQIEKSDVFVQDVLANILIVATVPFAFYLFGNRVLPMLFLWNAMLTYAIYTFPRFSQYHDLVNHREADGKDVPVLSYRSIVQACVVFLIALPLFFQLGGGIFLSTDMTFDSQRLLNKLPLPVSVIACFAGIALLIRKREAKLSAGILFFIFMAMAMSVLVVSAGHDENKVTKLIFMMQFVLPVFALVLGQSYITPENYKLRFEAVFLYVLLLVIPAQVFSTLAQGTGILTPYIYLFSIYQHLHYVPLIVVGLYILAVLTLMNYRGMKMAILLLSPFIGIYLAASTSFLALVMALLGVISFFYFVYKEKLDRTAVGGGVIMLVFLSGHLVGNPDLLHGILGGGLEGQTRQTVSQLMSQMAGVQVYTQGITTDLTTFIFGNGQRLEPEAISGGYNYYLDLVYNYGVISVLPFLYLFVITVSKLRKRWERGEMTTDLLGLALVVMFYLLIVNSFSVSFRQPYPGMVEFFLWGVLLSRLSMASSDMKS